MIDFKLEIYWWTVSGIFAIIYAIAGAVSKVTFSCPPDLDPKNNNGKKTKDYYDYYGNYTSILHAIFSVIICGYVLVLEGVKFGEPTSTREYFVISHSLGYFIYDTIQSEYHGYNQLAMTFHHIGALLVFGFGLSLQHSGNECLLIILVGELSNPFNLYREILKWKKQENTDIYHYSSVIFAILFILGRFVIGIFWIIHFYPGKSHLGIKIIFALLWYVSWHWLFIIINLATKEFKQRNSSTGSKFWEAAYSTFFKLRKSKAFISSYYIVTAIFSFGGLYIFHPSA